MKIGMIAMSGVRAYNEELTKFGLNLPGFVERSKVIASLPSLSLLTLAALTPEEFDVVYFEIENLNEKSKLPKDFDLVLISTFSAQIYEAYEIADDYMRLNIPVVMGGLHVSSLPEEAKAHCACVVVGEGEVLWPKVIADFGKGQMKEYYIQSSQESFDLANAPIPRYELLDIGKYNRLTVQTSRGCPHRCEFCASSILLTPKYKIKPVERVIAEIHKIKEFWPKPFIEFADDNSFLLRNYYLQLLTALKEEKIKWFTETDISIAEDGEMLRLMKQSGCKQVLIGLESLSISSLDHLEQRGNWKLKKLPDYETAINVIQSHGITVNGCFILGLDGDSETIFDEIYDFIDRTNLYEVQLTVLTAFPGTPLYARLKKEGRLIEDKAWHKCTLFDINHIPKGMSLDALELGFIDLYKRVYDKKFIEKRRKEFFKNLTKTSCI